MKRPLQPLLNWSCWAALRFFFGTAGYEHAVRNVNKEPEEPAQVADQEESPVAEAWQGFVEAKVGPAAFGQICHLHFEPLTIMEVIYSWSFPFDLVSMV